MGPRTLHHNKAFERDGAPRAFYRPLLEAMEDLGPEAFAGRRARAGEILGELGATFPLPGATGEGDRILPADWVPRIIPRDDWEELSYGLLQRGWAINAWLADLYHGDQRVVPNEVVESSVFYTPGRLPAHSAAAPVHVYGPDVVRLDSGEYVVLEDNVRVPSGVAYAEAIRRAGLNALEELFAPYRVNGVYAYYAVLRATLEAAAPPGVDIPSIMIVTGGPEDPAFFEHSHISEACGIRLVTLGDLRVSGGAVLAEPDGQRIDVIYRRVEGGYVVADLPELEETYRRGGVNLANALGVGVADDKAVFPYVPAMIEHYLGEEPVLSNAPTMPLWEPDVRAEVLDLLPELVLKPREGFGGKGILIGPEADAEEIERARREVAENPTGFVAQECLDFSSHLLDDADSPGEAFVDLRAFVLPAVGYVMPGGLTTPELRARLRVFPQARSRPRIKVCGLAPWCMMPPLRGLARASVLAKSNVLGASAVMAATVLAASTFSATPLVWRHAQYVRLAWSVQAKHPVEQPSIVACRYTGRCTN